MLLSGSTLFCTKSRGSIHSTYALFQANKDAFLKLHTHTSEWLLTLSCGFFWIRIAKTPIVHSFLFSQIKRVCDLIQRIWKDTSLTLKTVSLQNSTVFTSCPSLMHTYVSTTYVSRCLLCTQPLMYYAFGTTRLESTKKETCKFDVWAISNI